MRQKVIFLCLFLSVLSSRLYADMPAERIEFYPKIFEDRSQVLSVQEIISERYDSKFLYYSDMKQLHKDADYWGKLEIKNTSNFVEKRFLKFGKNARISCYIFDENQNVQIYKIGTALSYATQHQLSNIIPIEIAPNSRQMIVFRLKNPNAFPDFTLHLEKDPKLFLTSWESDFLIMALILLLPLGMSLFLIPHSWFWHSISWTKMALLTSAVLYFLMRLGLVFQVAENTHIFTAFWVYSAFILVDIFGKNSGELDSSTWHISREVFRALLPLFLALISGFLDYSILYFLDIMIGWEILMSVAFALASYFRSSRV